MARQISYGTDGFKKLLRGSQKLNDAVVVTMGAKGRNVLIEDSYGVDPFVTKDGVTVAKAVVLKDPEENIACSLIKRVALKTNEKVGDSTTASVCLAHAILQYGAFAVEAGANPVMLKRGIDLELQETIKYLNALKVPVENMEMAKKIALVSANGDENIADLIAEVYEKVGKDGNVAIEADLNSPDISYTKVEGLEFDRGFNNPYYITDLPTQRVIYENPLILISDYRIMSVYELKNVLEIAQRLQRPLVIISEEVDPDADNTMALNKLNGFPVVTINAPEFGDRRLNFLEDLAVVTGGSFISTVTGKTYDDVTEEDFGTCKKIIVERETTSVIGGAGTEAKVTERLDSIMAQIEAAKQEELKTYLQKRHARLKGGVVVIKVGGYSDIERREIKDRVEDAVNAVKTALNDGIIPGGGTPLMRISLTEINEVKEPKDVTEGRKVLKKALKTPFNQILVNAGFSDPAQIAGEILNSKDLDIVFDVYKEEFVNSIEGGVIDPALAIKTALINAASVAGTLLTTEATICYEPDQETTLKV